MSTGYWGEGIGAGMPGPETVDHASERRAAENARLQGIRAQTGVDPVWFETCAWYAQAIDATLAHPRGWCEAAAANAAGSYRFEEIRSYPVADWLPDNVPGPTGLKASAFEENAQMAAGQERAERILAHIDAKEGGTSAWEREVVVASCTEDYQRTKRWGRSEGRRVAALIEEAEAEMAAASRKSAAAAEMAAAKAEGNPFAALAAMRG